MNNNGWRTVKLSEIADIKTGKSNKQDAVANGKYAFFDRSPVMKKSSRYLFDCEAVIIPGEGKEFIPRYFKGKFDLHQRAYAITNFVEGVDVKFIFYLIMQKRQYFSQVATGSTVKSLRKPMFENFTLEMPPLTIQRKISELLFDYNELISNNKNRISSLEESAKRLHREWFVKFQFPGHEDVLMVDSELGPIPKGWAVKKLEEVLTLNYGKGLKKEDRHGGKVPVYGSSGVIGFHDNSLVEGPGIIVGRKGNVGSVFWSNEDFFVIDTAYFITSNLPLRFLFYDLQTKNYINSDAAVPGLSRKQAYSLDTIIPSKDMVALFCQKADKLSEQASIIQQQISNLRATRDLLLPKLISGQIDVSELDIATEEIVTA